MKTINHHKENHSVKYNTTNIVLLTAITNANNLLLTHYKDSLYKIRHKLIKSAIKKAKLSGIDLKDESKFYIFKIKKNDVVPELILEQSPIKFGKFDKYKKYETFPITKSHFIKVIERDGLKRDYFEEEYSYENNHKNIRLYFYYLKEEYKKLVMNKMVEDFNPKLESIMRRFADTVSTNLSIGKIEKLSVEFINKNNKLKSWKELYKLFKNKTNIMYYIENNIDIDIKIIHNKEKIFRLEDCEISEVFLDIYENLANTPRLLSNLKRKIIRANLNVNMFEYVLVDKRDSRNMFIAILKDKI